MKITIHATGDYRDKYTSVALEIPDEADAFDAFTAARSALVAFGYHHDSIDNAAAAYIEALTSVPCAGDFVPVVENQNN